MSRPDTFAGKVSPSERATLAAVVPAAPLRTCVGCRKRAERNTLLRVVAVEVGGQLFADPDPERRRPGRGAWMHPDPNCLQSAERRSAFTRALRVSAAVSTERLRNHLVQHDDQSGQQTARSSGRAPGHGSVQE